ncbi:MAG: Clp protease N-terminal domain-containing protein [Pseudonocardiaceae bacterium]
MISAAQALAGGAPLGSHHLLEALVRSEGSMAAQVLAGLGIDPEKIAAKVDALDPDQTTDSSPEESAARKMELRLEGGNLHVVLSDESTVALARVVSDLAGGTITATGPITGAFVPLWSSTNDLLRELHRALSPEEESDVEETGVASRFLRRVIRDRLQRRS